MRKQGARLLASVMLCMLLTGCWDRTELNELGITAATSVDKIGDNWIVSYQLIIPSAISTLSGGGAGGISPITVHSTKARTIREAVAKSKLESPRQLYFAHNRILVVSERAARYGLSSLIDVYFRLPNSRETVSMLITEGSPVRILRQLMSIQPISGQGVQQIISNESRSYSLLPHVKLYKFAMNIVGDARAGVMPEILVSGSPNVDAVNQMGETNQPSRLKLGRLAVFKSDRFYGWFSQRESFGVSFLTDEVNQASISFNCGGGSDQQGGMNSAVTLTRSQTKVKPHIVDGHLQMEVHVKSAGMLEETVCTDNLQDPKVIKRMEGSIQKEINGIIMAAWEACKRDKVDVLGFAGAVHRKYPKQWKRMKQNWDQEFASADLKLTVDFKLERIGVSNKSFKSLEEPEGE
ncbi:spore germination protein KC [Paenibacillus phyllosphaerae]|uniref:Spore germination protein KC n=1 Tax=Paenibacillus phyllosphaerae TaxID=274593 RepID=A0A7W5B255_9BACL|nr:Ger(x)C family spore germination protein [Paenibacillus phyllosphaerae]MBB3113059.1 spore germination protein KC [Paenibacillus phyllosphaerae]